MKITVLNSERDFDVAAGWKIVGQMLNKRDSVIGLSTGRTTGGMHKAAADIFRAHPFDTAGITIFGVDEFAKVPETFEGTCRKRLWQEIVKAMEIKLDNFIMPVSICNNYENESRKYADELKARGGVDLQMLGIGPDGHIGMNLPGTSFGSTARLTKLSGELEERIRTKNNYPAPLPLEGITLGIKEIMNIRHIVLVAKGETKAAIIKAALCGPVTEEVPASILQLHPNCEVLLDKKAAAALS